MVPLHALANQVSKVLEHHVLMLMNVPLVPITVTSMPTALTQMEPSVALANQVSKALEIPAQM
jgi:type IV pilus biogenesis protein CpaD/CtpE